MGISPQSGGEIGKSTIETAFSYGWLDLRSCGTVESEIRASRAVESSIANSLSPPR
jgi:hypothetical protein